MEYVPPQVIFVYLAFLSFNTNRFLSLKRKRLHSENHRERERDGEFNAKKKKITLTTVYQI